MKSSNILPMLLILTGSSVHAADFSLCDTNEKTVWACSASEINYAVCASSHLTDSEGYLQYRTDSSATTSLFKYPAEYHHPGNYFSFGLGSGNAFLSFNIGKDAYTITEDINGAANIHIQQHEKDITIVCDESTDTLTLTSTINFIKGAGIAR